MKRLSWTILSTTCVVGLWAVLAGGCGDGDIGEFCKAKNDCEDGNEADEEACIVQQNAALDAAAAIGCGEFADILAKCAVEESECENADFFTSADRCDDEQRELNSCLSTSGINL